MFCKWCGNKIQPTDRSCKACGRETPAMSDCGGLYNLRYEAPAATAQPSFQPDPQVGRRMEYLQQQQEQDRAVNEKRIKLLGICAGALLVGVIILLVLCLGQRETVNALQQQLASLEDCVDDIQIPEHLHESSQGYSSDSQYHWQTVSCQGNEFMMSFGAHADEDLDGVCDVCGWFDPTHTHSYADTWNYDTQYHWHRITCAHTGAEVEKIAHVDENLDGVCDDCQYQMCEHTYSDAWTSNENGHWHEITCGHTGVANEIFPHEKDEDNDGACDDCGFQLCEHDYDRENWRADETGHWYAATCGHDVKGELTDHSYDENYQCTVCGYLHKHTYSEAWTYDETGHWHSDTCNHGTVTDTIAHTDGDNDCVCDECGQQMPDSETQNPDPDNGDNGDAGDSENNPEDKEPEA